MPDQQTIEPFGIYIHWPFCESLCPYCDFNTYCSNQIDHEQWCEAYLRQLDHSAKELEANPCTSVYFGGGTPSLMESRTVGKILDRISLHWGFSDQLEITLEANPTTVEQDRFLCFRSEGINRLSLGVQALKDSDLKALGRKHGVKEAIKAYETADRVFNNISLDFMFGRQFQSRESWIGELHEIVALNPNHLSIYQLTIEPNTPFGKRYVANRLEGIPDEDILADMYLATMEICERNGFKQYEISNYSKPGYKGRHNLVYWEYHDFLGIGPGAHGRISINNQYFRTNTILSPESWLDGIFKLGTGENQRELIDLKERGSEYLITSLRLNDGMNIDRFERISGSKLDNNTISELVQDNWVEITDGQLKVTTNGRMVLNQIISKLLS
ncbi:MAG: radical SAM family heme chaperone HemW [Paracoccaceae bacterium]|nr:radical SAM family heme chaperone HemW [Paracoccaceae bacterium]